MPGVELGPVVWEFPPPSPTPIALRVNPAPIPRRRAAIPPIAAAGAPAPEPVTGPPVDLPGSPVGAPGRDIIGRGARAGGADPAGGGTGGFVGFSEGSVVGGLADPVAGFEDVRDVIAAIFAASEGGILRGPPIPDPVTEPLTPAFKAEGPGLRPGAPPELAADAELGGRFGRGVEAEGADPVGLAGAV